MSLAVRWRKLRKNLPFAYFSSSSKPKGQHKREYEEKKESSGGKFVHNWVVSASGLKDDIMLISGYSIVFDKHSRSGTPLHEVGTEKPCSLLFFWLFFLCFCSFSTFRMYFHTQPGGRKVKIYILISSFAFLITQICSSSAVFFFFCF